MIDFYNEYFTIVADEVRKAHPGANVVGEFVRQPSRFPTVTLDEYENVMESWLEDSSGEENFAGVSLRLQVFSNKRHGKKSEARAIFATADAVMRKLGFRRVSYTTTPDHYDTMVYQITATYEAIISASGCVYKRR